MSILEETYLVKHHKIVVHRSQQSNLTSCRIIFLHGNSLSAEIFRNQFNTEALKKYELITIDLPGHGKSSHRRETDEKYSYKDLKETLLYLLNDLKIKDSVFVANSLAGNLLFELLPDIPEIKGMIVNGAPPFTIPFSPEKMLLPNPNSMLFAKGKLTSNEIQAMADLLLNENSELKSFINEQISKSDPNFRIDMLKCVMDGSFADQVAAINNSKVPLCIINGENEKISNINYILDNINSDKLFKKKVIQVNNASHLPFLENPDEFNNILLEFLREILT